MTPVAGGFAEAWESVMKLEVVEGELRRKGAWEGCVGVQSKSRGKSCLGWQVMCSDSRNVQQAMRNSDVGLLKGMRAKDSIYLIPQ